MSLCYYAKIEIFYHFKIESIAHTLITKYRTNTRRINILTSTSHVAPCWFHLLLYLCVLYLFSLYMSLWTQWFIKLYLLYKYIHHVFIVCVVEYIYTHMPFRRGLFSYVIIALINELVYFKTIILLFTCHIEPKFVFLSTLIFTTKQIPQTWFHICLFVG